MVEKLVTIGVPEDLKKALQDMKLYRKEAYYDIIGDLISHYRQTGGKRGIKSADNVAKEMYQ